MSTACRCASRSSAASPSPSSRSSSSGSGPAGASTATSTWPRRRTTAPASTMSARPAGNILDRDGNVLVDNRTSLALQLNPRKLPADPAEQRAELARLGRARPTCRCARCAGRSRRAEEVAAGAPVTLRRDVGYDLVYYLEENQRRFPGVEVQRVFVRAYPDGTAAAHVLGSVGEVSEEELKEPRYQALEPGDEIGKGGVEYTYDRYLRGEPGLTRIQVNALGQPTPGGQLVSEPPAPGDNLKLTIDPDVQAAGEGGARRARPAGRLRDDERQQRRDPRPRLLPDLRTRRSSPGPLTQSRGQRTLPRPGLAPLHQPRHRRLYPTGSTFKIITGAGGARKRRDHVPRRRSSTAARSPSAARPSRTPAASRYGPVTLVPALQVSSDVFFYDLGLEMWDTDELQRWAAQARDRPSRPGSTCPARPKAWCRAGSWRDQLYEEGETDRPWSAGDNIQLATGQGDLQTNPLQMAIAYAALGNGGTIVTPHVGMEVEDAAGRVLKEFDPPPRRQIQIDPAYRAAILAGPARRRAGARKAPPTTVFGGFPIQVAGKTGTAQRPPHADQSWYAVLAPYPTPRIVTVVTIEEGGFGAESAAPAALQILEAYFDKQADRPRPGPTEAVPADVRDPHPPCPARAVRRPSRHRRAPRPALHGRPLTLAAVALVGFSVFTLGQATTHDVPGSPGLLRRPPGDLRRARHGRDVAARPASTTRASASCGSASTPSSAPASRWSSSSASPPAARGAPSNFPSSASSHRSSASSCWCLPSPASSSMAPGGARRGSARCATSASAWHRLRSSSCSRTWAPRWCSRSSTLAVMYFGGVPWTHFAVIGAALVALIAIVLVVAPAVGAPLLKGYQEQRLTSFLQPERGPRGRGLPAEPGQGRHRLR